jgi:hypothetical protein
VSTQPPIQWDFPGVKQPGREADHSPPSSVEVKNIWSYTSTQPYVFMAWYLVKRKDFTFIKIGKSSYRADAIIFSFLSSEISTWRSRTFVLTPQVK